VGRILPSRRIAAAAPNHPNEHQSLIGDPDKRKCRILTLVHPVLFHLGSILIPCYGATAAVGVLLALFLAQRTAHTTGLDPGKIWNLCVVALFAALAGSRLLLIALNWSALRLHPSWMLTLAMIHHPLLGAFGALAAAVVAIVYGRGQRLPLWSTADALAVPVALGLAFEQFGALLVGSGYGTETAARWAVTYTDPLAARWSGAPLGVALHPVQAYAALAFLTLSICLLLWLPHRRQSGDVAGLLLLGAGVVVFITEFWRDPEGRGSLLGGALDGPQAAAVALVVVGGLVLLEHAGPVEGRGIPPLPQEQKRGKDGAPILHEISAKDEAAHG
jgi:phosphatidylglycerol:prolipoprotein diacylglycerol transferase